MYLFIRIRRTILSSQKSDRFKSLAIRLAGAGIALFFALNAYLLFVQIPWVDPPIAAQVGLFYPMAIWNFGSLFSALLLFLMRLAGGLTRLIVRMSGGHPARRASPVNIGRRRFLQAGVGGVAGAPLLLSGYGAAYAGKAYDVEKLSLPFGRSLRIVQLTDIHAGIYLTREEMRRYARQAMALEPDLLVLTGDFISNSMAFLPACVEEMARVRPRYGTFATLGNLADGLRALTSGSGRIRLVEGNFPSFSALLGEADEVFVTGDSVSMLSEAIQAGKSTAIIPLELDRKGRDKLGETASSTGKNAHRRDLRRFWDYLIEQGFAGTLDSGARKARKIPRPADEAAKTVRKMLGRG